MTLRTSLLQQLENPALTSSQRAELRCQLAREHESTGDYEAARAAMGELWSVVGERPKVEGLGSGTAAEVLLRVGVLTGRLGSIHGIKDAQESAKNLLSEAIGIFESLSFTKKILEAQIELAYCYWREGAYNEARIVISDVLSQLKTDNELKARALLQSAVVEWSSVRYNDSLCILVNAAPLFEKIRNHTLKGSYHDALAGVLVNLGESERREDYTDRAFVEYAAASYHFEQAGHKRYLANVENNLGFLYFKVGRYEEAHEHLDHARRVLVGLKASSTIAQVDETRARVFIAQERYNEAEKAAWSAVRTLEEGGRQSLLAEALTTHGLALARLGYPERARFTLFRAVDVAHLCGASNTAGLAALAVLEELSEHVEPEDMRAVYLRAYEWLLPSQHTHTLHRLLKAANQLLNALSSPQKALSLKSETKGTLRELVGKYEKEIIRQALRNAEGSVTRAARLLGIQYQALVYLLERRHKDLLSERSPARTRKRQTSTRRRK